MRWRDVVYVIILLVCVIVLWCSMLCFAIHLLCYVAWCVVMSYHVVNCCGVKCCGVVCWILMLFVMSCRWVFC